MTPADPSGERETRQETILDALLRTLRQSEFWLGMRPTRGEDQRTVSERSEAATAMIVAEFTRLTTALTTATARAEAAEQERDGAVAALASAGERLARGDHEGADWYVQQAAPVMLRPALADLYARRTSDTWAWDAVRTAFDLDGTVLARATTGRSDAR